VAITPAAKDGIGMNARLDDIRAALTTGHIYVGLCPDEINRDSRDWLCPACRVLTAIDQVLAGQVEADVFIIATRIVAGYEHLQPDASGWLKTQICMAIRDAEARANHRALDIQYALDAEHAAHQPIAIASGGLPEAFTRALWWRRGAGWQVGYHSRLDGARHVLLDSGSKIPLDMFTHWIPEIPDPNVTPPPAA
jgi:hypothetical protein